MSDINAARLLKLADHLESGALAHPEFRFDRWNATADGSQVRAHTMSYGNLLGCGFAGCAIGECPAVFPEEWCFAFGPNDPFYLPTLRSNLDILGRANSDNPITDVCSFFNLTYSEMVDLFVPSSEGEPLPSWNDAPLTKHATAKEVALSLRRFVAMKWGYPHGTEVRVVASLPPEPSKPWYKRWAIAINPWW